MLTSLGKNVLVKRNDAVDIQNIEKLAPEAIVLSPGPGHPLNSGICLKVIERFANRIPMLGVCLGHQAIGQVFGANIQKAKKVKHGKLSRIIHDGKGLFTGVDNKFLAMRYHSLVIAKDTLPTSLEILAYSEEDGEIMAIKHQRFPIYGVQFHPESIGTPDGVTLLSNFLQIKSKELSVHA